MTDPKSEAADLPSRKPLTLYQMLAPGILVAATGVGSGDLLTAALAGSAVGLVILWSAPIGALLKWTVTEGLARWQMATGTTLLEGWIAKFGTWAQWVFLIYLLVWSLFTGAAMVNGCGVGMTAVLPIGDENQSKIVWAILHSLVGLALVWYGGFDLFEKLMAGCIAVMFFTVIGTAILVGPDWAQAGVGILVPRIPDHPEGVSLIVAVLGGVGGTLTILSYGYWIREQKREGAQGVAICRRDLGVGYVMTGFFGAAMILIGSRVTITGKGDSVALALAQALAEALGPTWGPMGKWFFLTGFWAAVFSSLLGVWQGIPYLFADFLAIRRGLSPEKRASIDYTKTFEYRTFLLGIALLPLLLLWQSVKQIQLTYAIIGATVLPLLALSLLVMNNRRDWVGERFRSGWFVNALLVGTLAFFGYAGWTEVAAAIARM